jgi:CRISPR-associated protein Csb2
VSVSVEVTFLTGRCVATDFADRSQVEWPPHPARLYSALVATWADADEPDHVERDLLMAMETWPAPEMTYDAAPARRTVVTHYVPVNDPSVVRTYDTRASKVVGALASLSEAARSGDTKLAKRASTALVKERDVAALVAADPKAPVSNAFELLPDGRPKQARTFPSVGLAEPRVVYKWSALDLETHVVRALDALLGRLVRLGHSSSLVSCRLVADASSAQTPEPTAVPDDAGQLDMRWIGAGQLEQLERAFERHGGTRPRALPNVIVRYRSGAAPVAPVPPASAMTSGEWFVFEIEGRRTLPSIRTVQLARLLRDSLMSHIDDPIPELISGHRADGSASTRPHASYLALPFVGRDHATGAVMGVAVMLPRRDAVDREEYSAARRALLRGIGQFKAAGAQLGRLGTMRHVSDPPDLHALRRRTWEAPSESWVSATPIALPRHPGKLTAGVEATQQRSWERADEIVAEACVHAGLPEPAEAWTQLAPLAPGVRPARDFPAFVSGQGTEARARLLVHASIRFAQPVRGPLVLGAGRHFGLGLMRPVRAASNEGGEP